MPSLDHEALVALFRNRPTLAAELLRDALGLDLPGFVEARIEDSDLTTIVPASFEADLVVALRGEKTRLGIIVEVQLAPDEDKPFSWLAYVANLQAKIRAPVALLVVTPSEEVVRWCRRRLPFAQPSVELRPFVLGPREVPIVTDEAEAREAPELAVLSALAHSQSEYAFAVGKAALSATALLDEDRARLYCDLILSKSTARAELEEVFMIPAGYKYQSDFAKKWIAVGREEGLEQGIEQGRILAKAEALLVFLQARGLTIDEEARIRIRECEDVAKLDGWIARAATAEVTDDLFDDG